MTIRQWLIIASKSLTGSSSPRLDSELMASKVLGKNRAWILANDSALLAQRHTSRLNYLLSKRARMVPMAHILNNANFYGRDFYIDIHVLSPRPESEDFFSCLKSILDAVVGLKSLIDVGTGSGVLAITAKLEHPTLSVTATDISATALAVASQNANELHAEIILKKQNLLMSDGEEYDIVMANLPYVPIAMRHPSISQEPSRALYSGHDGLNHYRRLFKQLNERSTKYVLTESLDSQHMRLVEIADKEGYRCMSQRGLVQIFSKIG